MRVLIAAIVLLNPALLPAQKTSKDSEPRTAPRYVLIIRHAEKPADTDPSPDLAPAGIARSQALTGMFTASPTRPNPFPRPDFIFASRNTKRSHRPFETVAPLGTALGVAIDTSFQDDAGTALAWELLRHSTYAGKTVLIVWHQGSIPELAKALGAKDAPAKWKDSVFDRVWVITYDPSGHVTFQNRPQQLMSGDARK